MDTDHNAPPQRPEASPFRYIPALDPKPLASLEEIKRRVQRAESVGIHFVDGPHLYWKYYEDDEKNKSFINDFYFLLRLAEKVMGENSDLRYRLESAGIDPDKELAEIRTTDAVIEAIEKGA